MFAEFNSGKVGKCGDAKYECQSGTLIATNYALTGAASDEACCVSPYSILLLDLLQLVPTAAAAVLLVVSTCTGTGDYLLGQEV